MIVNLDDYKHNKKEMIIVCIKRQIIADYQFTPKDMTEELIKKLDTFANQVYDFHDYIKNRPLN